MMKMKHKLKCKTKNEIRWKNKNETWPLKNLNQLSNFLVSFEILTVESLDGISNYYY
jgi:hypothetical protein